VKDKYGYFIITMDLSMGIFNLLRCEYAGKSEQT